MNKPLKARSPILPMAAIFFASLLAPLLLCSSGCKGTVLTPDGAYQNDLVLLNFDEASKAAHKSIDGVIQWEADNRAWLDVHVPGASPFVEKLKVDSRRAFAKAAEARRLYIVSRTTGTVGEINNALDAVNALVELALAYYTQNKTQNPAHP